MAHHQASIQALKAFGSIVRIEPNVFLELLSLQEQPLVVQGSGGFLTSHYRYIMSYQGITFFAKSNKKLELPANAKIIETKKVFVPDVLTWF